MKRHLLAALALAAVVLLGSCSDGGAPAPTAPGLRTADATALTCPTPAGLATLANTVFGAGSPSARSVSAKVDKIVRLVAKGDKVGAKQAAFDAVKFVLQAAGKSRFPKNDTAVNIALNSLVQGMFCLAGITMPDPASSPSGAALVYPTDAPQVITTGDGLGGVSLPANPVSEPTLITITPITDVFAPGAGPLHTKLDQYPGYYEFKKQSPTDPPLLHPVVVGVCPTGSMPADVRARLRLGHDATAGFEVTPPADASFLTCPSPTALNGRVPAWLSTLASLVLPRPLLASGVRLLIGGVGGSAGEFSPFGPVDPLLAAIGGVGGSAGEFLVAPAGSGNPLSAPPETKASTSSSRKAVAAPTMLQQLATRALPGSKFLTSTFTASCSVAALGSALIPECRPLVTITTRLGTPFIGVPVTWAVGAGGGVVAAEGATLGCGAFGATASNATGTLGKAGACWTMGAAAGVNTLVATPSLGGDALAGVSFSPASLTFTVTTSLTTPTVGATGGSVTFDGAAHPGSGTCSDGLTPALSYSGGGVPVAVGEYMLTVSCGAGNPLYVTVSATAAISITPYVQSACFASPMSMSPTPNSFVVKGTTVPLSCMLLNGAGAPVTGATGGLLVEDMGVYANISPPPGPGVVVFSGVNVFTASGGAYTYGLDTSPAGYVHFHLYRATTTWNDGSTTMGYFFVN